MNVCAPVGRDARVFFEAAAAAPAAGREGGGGGVDKKGKTHTHPHPPTCTLLSIPSAGHLQLLDDRKSLPFAEMCGVGKTYKEEELHMLVSEVMVACCRAWSYQDGGSSSAANTYTYTQTLSEVEEEGEREMNRKEEGMSIKSIIMKKAQSINPSLASSLVWEGGEGEEGGG